MEFSMFAHKFMSLVLLLAAAPASAEEPGLPPAEVPAPAPPPTPDAVPIAQLENAQAGEAFVGKEVVIEGMFGGMLPLSTSEQIQIPKKYKKTHVRFAVLGDAGSISKNIVLPLDLAGPLYSTPAGAKVRVTGVVDHIVSPMMLQTTALNRMIIASKVEIL